MARSSVERLVKNHRMQAEHQAERFEMALEELWEENPPLRALYTAFDDETECPEAMWSLIHFLDTRDLLGRIKALIAETSVLAKQAPEWMQILHTCLINDAAATRVYREELAHAPKEIALLIGQVLDQQADRGSL